MKALLKGGADKATAATVLILPQRINDALETLAGEAVSHGVVAEADEAALIDALNAAAKERADQFLTAKDLRKETQWMSKALSEFEVGSQIGLNVKGGGRFELDVSKGKDQPGRGTDGGRPRCRWPVDLTENPDERAGPGRLCRRRKGRDRARRR
jgi:hypothetical protein